MVVRVFCSVMLVKFNTVGIISLNLLIQNCICIGIINLFIFARFSKILLFGVKRLHFSTVRKWLVIYIYTLELLFLI